MKSLLSVLPFLLLSSCSKPVVAGSGTQAVDERGFSGYTVVEARGASLKLVLTTGNTELVRVSGDDNIVPKVETALSGETLTIRTGNKVLRPKVPLLVEVTARRLKEIRLTGAVEADVEDFVDSRLTATITGVGKLRATGVTERLEVTMNGAGELDAAGLVAQNAEVSIVGAGSAEVHVTGRLEADVKGAGKIRYHGKPEVVQDVLGVGSVRPADAQ